MLSPLPPLRRGPANSVLLAVAAVSALSLLSPTASTAAAAVTPKQAAAPGPAVATPPVVATPEQFQAAAREFGVPAPVLMAVAYEESRWQAHAGEPSRAGGFGPMHLLDQVAGVNGSSAAGVLGAAARLARVDPAKVRLDPTQNIRAGAALLAAYQRELTGGMAENPAVWYGAVARYAQASVLPDAIAYADDVFATLRRGREETVAGHRLTLPASPDLVPDRSTLGRLGLPAGTAARAPWQPECPPGLGCDVKPAALATYGQGPLDYGNYWVMDRPKELSIRYIVIHDTEESYQEAVKRFQDPRSNVSAHYTIRSNDGHVTQSLRARDGGWHAGNKWLNFHSIGIEHEGKAAKGATWYTERMYKRSAALVGYLAKKYGIPLDRGHIIGHDNVAVPTTAMVKKAHWDPGPYWDWTRYFELMGVRAPAAGGGQPRPGQVVQINPVLAQNRQTVQNCPPDGSVKPPNCPLQTESSNFLPLRTEPRADAPYFADPGVHEDGTPGSNIIFDWGSKVSTGQRYVVAETSGDWTAIWYAGARAWFRNPGGRLTSPARGVVLTPKAGVQQVAVYGTAYPDAAEFRDPVPAPPETRLTQYPLPAGQRYLAYEPAAVPGDFISLRSMDRTQPGDGTVVVSGHRYWPIQYHHRLAFVRADQVNAVPTR